MEEDLWAHRGVVICNIVPTLPRVKRFFKTEVIGPEHAFAVIAYCTGTSNWRGLSLFLERLPCGTSRESLIPLSNQEIFVSQTLERELYEPLTICFFLQLLPDVSVATNRYYLHYIRWIGAVHWDLRASLAAVGRAGKHGLTQLFLVGVQPQCSTRGTPADLVDIICAYAHCDLDCVYYTGDLNRLCQLLQRQ
jgi:hypothetical protein